MNWLVLRSPRGTPRKSYGPFTPGPRKTPTVRCFWASFSVALTACGVCTRPMQQRPRVMTGVLLGVLLLSVPALAQKVTDEPTAVAPASSSTPPSPSPSPSTLPSASDANAATTTPENTTTSSGGVTAHPPRQLAPGEQAAIPQSD